MEDKAWEGISWTIITLLSGIAVGVSSHPIPKLIGSLIAIGTGTKAVDCFQSSARIAYQQLTAPKEYHQRALGSVPW